MKFMQIKPQKARGALKKSMWTDPKWVAEEKFDGDRRIAQFMGGEQVTRFTGTRESVDGSGYVEKTENIPHLSGYGDVYPFSKNIETLNGTVLDGEIIAPFAKDLPGGKSKYVTAIMGSKPERAIALQEKHGWLEYMVFDCLYWKGEDVRAWPLDQRRELAGTALLNWSNKYAKLVQQCDRHTDTFYLNVTAAGGEGVILKHANHTYGNEKLWVKVKKDWTADVVIIGFEPGKGKYKGQVGAIIFGQYEKRVPRPIMEQLGSCSGFDDLLREQLTAHPDRYISQVIEIQHNGREPTGAFRHPRFKRFRLDKSAKSCVYRKGEI